MISRFLKGLDKDEAEKVTEEFNRGVFLRGHLSKVLKQDVESLINDMKSEKHFDSPNYTLVQVDRVAQIKAYEKIISLLSN